jgi:hypothetical protein
MAGSYLDAAAFTWKLPSGGLARCVARRWYAERPAHLDHEDRIVADAKGPQYVV